MQQSIFHFIAVVVCIALCCACSDELLDNGAAGVPSTEVSENTIVLDAFGHDFTLPITEKMSVEDFEVIDGDFILPIGKSTLYVEQNDDAAYRTARIMMRMADGSEQHLTLTQPPASRSSSSSMHRSFYRHHALGYSYDALGGEYCDLSSVRCSV